MPSLEKLIKQFAERARRQLMEEVERLKNEDTSTAKWEGYDADGNPIVKDGDQTKTVKGLGNTGMVKGTKLILDDVGSVEYKRRTKQEDKVNQKTPKKKRRVPESTRLVVRDNLISVAPVFEEEIRQLEDQDACTPFGVPTNGFYVCTYSTLRPDQEIHNFLGVETPIITGLVSYDVSDTNNVASYTDQATGGTTWRVAAGGVAAASRRIGGIDGTASANLSGLGINLSVTCSGDQEKADTAIEITQTSDGGAFDYELSGSREVLAIELIMGNAVADASCAHITFPRAVWYYQILNDPEDETLTQIREIDLNDIVPGQVFESRLVHNYATREDDNAFVYSVWYVITVDMTQTETDIIVDNEDEKDIEMFIGKKTRYIVHARLNIRTCAVETKYEESPNTGNFRGAPFLDVIEYPNTASIDGQWLVGVRTFADASGGVGSSTGASTSITTANRGIESTLSRDWFNPEAVWRRSYTGDWINAYSDIPWDNAAFSNITDNELNDFLFSSYKEGKFYRGWDSLMPTDLVTPEFIEWDPTGDPFEGNARPSGTFNDIENLQAAIELNGTSIEYANYFDGSQANAPDDFDQWRIWAGTDYEGIDDERLGPNFATPDNVNETGTPLGDRLREYTWFSYVPPSA